MAASLIEEGRPSRGRAHGLVPVALLILGAACSYFPSHEEVYIPIPLAIGEPLIENGDTNYVLAGPGFRLIAPRRQVLADARHDIEAAVRQFERFFGRAPDAVTVRYVDSLDARILRDREIERLTGVPRAPDEIVLPSSRMPAYRGDRTPLPPPAAPAAARTWIVAHARRVADEARGGTSSGDTGRVPAWLAAALGDLIAYGIGGSASARQLWERRGDLIPLDSLFALDRLDAGRESENRLRQRDIDRIGLRRAQSLSIARYIVEREGEDFLGAMADRIFRGASTAEALRGAEVMPSEVVELDRAWRDWLQQTAAR